MGSRPRQGDEHPAHALLCSMAHVPFTFLVTLQSRLSGNISRHFCVAVLVISYLDDWRTYFSSAFVTPGCVYFPGSRRWSWTTRSWLWDTLQWHWRIRLAPSTQFCRYFNSGSVLRLQPSTFLLLTSSDASSLLTVCGFISLFMLKLSLKRKVCHMSVSMSIVDLYST